MSSLFTLAADYIERMANPAFGITTNEDYATKFGKLLESEGFRISTASGDTGAKGSRRSFLAWMAVAVRMGQVDRGRSGPRLTTASFSQLVEPLCKS